MTDIFGIPIGIWGPSSLLAFAILLLLTGRLWTDRAYRELKQDRDTWKEACKASELARAEAFAQNAQLFEQGKATHAIVEAMFGVLKSTSQSGGNRHASPLA